jgi:hypothetical protein
MPCLSEACSWSTNILSVVFVPVLDGYLKISAFITATAYDIHAAVPSKKLSFLIEDPSLDTSRNAYPPQPCQHNGKQLHMNKFSDWLVAHCSCTTEWWYLYLAELVDTNFIGQR